MSDASTTQSVECPICGEEFDPTVAGGWCTNTECGEWQYTEATAEEGAVEDDGFVTKNEMDESDDEGFVSADEMDEDDEADESPDASAVFAADDDAETDDEPDEEPVEAETDEQAVDAAGSAAEESVAETDEPVAEEDAEPDAEPVAEDVEETAAEAEEPDAEADEPAATDAESEAAEADAAVEEAAEADTAADDAAEADTIDCPDCGVELDADANFCLECGADVSDVAPASPLTECPGCDAEVSPDDNFCVNCGEDLTAHRGGDDGAEAEDAVDTLEGDDEPVPESLLLAVEGREIGVEDGEKVGREVRAALMDAGRPEEEAVRIHREHVRFVRESDSFYLLDLGDNPTKLNGRTLTKGDREPIAPGDTLELSGVADIDIRAP